MARPKSADPTRPITLRLPLSLWAELERRATSRGQNVRGYLQDAAVQACLIPELLSVPA